MSDDRKPSAMERAERFSSAESAMQASLDGFQASLWTSLPGFIVSYDAARQTASVQPAIKARQRMPDLTWRWVDLPVCPDVPVEFPNGGGFSLTFPVKPGDECVLDFQARCLDSWWYYGLGNPPRPQVQAEMRMHDLSDAICRVGPRSLPRALGAVSTTTVQLRSDDGTCYIEIAPGGVVNILAPGGVNITGDVAVDGDVTVTGEVKAGSPQIKLTTHEHPDIGHPGGAPFVDKPLP